MTMALDITLYRFGTSLLMSRADFDRVADQLKRAPVTTSATTVPA